MKKIAIAASLMFVFGAQEAIAQTAGATVDGTVEQSLYINLNQTAVTFANANAAAFNDGYTQITGGTLTHKGNVVHSVTLAAGAATMTGTALDTLSTARADKPAGDVKWSINGTTFTDASTTAAAVASSVAAGEYSKSLTYRMALAWALDKPGKYSLGLTYTIAAN